MKFGLFALRLTFEFLHALLGDFDFLVARGNLLQAAFKFGFLGLEFLLEFAFLVDQTFLVLLQFLPRLLDFFFGVLFRAGLEIFRALFRIAVDALGIVPGFRYYFFGFDRSALLGLFIDRLFVKQHTNGADTQTDEGKDNGQNNIVHETGPFKIRWSVITRFIAMSWASWGSGVSEICRSRAIPTFNG